MTRAHSTNPRYARSDSAPAAPDVLLVSEVYPPAVGGSGHLLESIYSRLDSHPVRVLSGPAHINGAHWGVLNIAGVRSHLSLARTIRRLNRDCPSVVHCGRALPEGLAAAIARSGPGGPKFVFWAHGEEITTALTSRDYTLSMRWVHRHASAAIANSQHTARVLESVGMDPVKTHVVHPGVDARRFAPYVDGSAIRRRFAPNGETLLLSLGRCHRKKGFDLTIRALARLAREHRSLRHLVVGDGEDRAGFEALARELGVHDRVSFTGEVPAADLPKYFAACDLFVHPNRTEAHDFEGFGLVFLEAAASEKPSIGGATGGVREAIQDGVTGLLVSGTDVDELAAAIARLAGSEPLRRRMGRNARARVLLDFTWERAASAVGAIHQQAAGS